MGSTKGKTREAYFLKVSENALHDIDHITGYIAFIKHQPINAIRAGDRIFQTIGRIEQNPLAFHECEEIPTKTKVYRKATCMSWHVIYKVQDSEIIILGIIHVSRRASKIRRLRSEL
jgi:plasmid stabilization system protein ParE